MTVLRSDRIELRPLTATDVTGRYVGWLNDPGTNRYMGVGRVVSTLESVRDYVAAFEGRADRYLFAIAVRDTGEHIGNITLQDIDAVDLRGEIGLLVGEPEWRGRGVGSEAIAMVVSHAFDDLGLHKLTAGYVAGNDGSARAFAKNGFVVEGVLREQFALDGEFADVYRLGLLASERRVALPDESESP